MTGKERREREAALGKLLDGIENRIYPLVAEAVDFARLDMVEQTLATELERLVAEGKLPTPDDPKQIPVRARAMVATMIYRLPQDPRRSEHSGDDECELCRLYGDGTVVS